MSKSSQIPTLSLALLALALPLTIPSSGRSKSGKEDIETTGKASAILWQDPKDLTSRDLLYGAGGKGDEPHPPFSFVEEDMAGTNPKFVV